jgi:hypothetical protein
MECFDNARATDQKEIQPAQGARMMKIPRRLTAYVIFAATALAVY